MGRGKPLLYILSIAYNGGGAMLGKNVPNEHHCQLRRSLKLGPTAQSGNKLNCHHLTHLFWIIELKLCKRLFVTNFS